MHEISWGQGSTLIHTNGQDDIDDDGTDTIEDCRVEPAQSVRLLPPPRRQPFEEGPDEYSYCDWP